MNLKSKHGFMISILGVGYITGSLVPILDIVRLMQFAIGFGATIGTIMGLSCRDSKRRVKNIYKLMGVVSPVIVVTSFIGIIDTLTLISWAIGSALIVGGLIILADH